MRVDKYLSQKDICSRREAKRLIGEGRVLVNGVVINEVVDVSSGDVVEVKGCQDKLSVLVYKPRGVISSKDKEHKNVFDVFPMFRHLHCVGRLDKESEGALILSNDGVLAKKITGLHKIEKKYLVYTQEEISDWQIERLAKGIRLRDGVAKAVRVERAGKKRFVIVLVDGRKHQIRRMADAVRLTVVKLKRLCIGRVCLGEMKPGEWRRLSDEEVRYFKGFK